MINLDILIAAYKKNNQGSFNEKGFFDELTNEINNFKESERLILFKQALTHQSDFSTELLQSLLRKTEFDRKSIEEIFGFCLEKAKNIQKFGMLLEILNEDYFVSTNTFAKSVCKAINEDDWNRSKAIKYVMFFAVKCSEPESFLEAYLIDAFAQEFDKNILQDDPNSDDKKIFANAMSQWSQKIYEKEKAIIKNMDQYNQSGPEGKKIEVKITSSLAKDLEALSL